MLTFVKQSLVWWDFVSAMAESWKMLKTSNLFLSFIVNSNRNRSALVRELLCNNSLFVGQLCMLVIWSSLQLTSKQWIITQQFTARADLFLKSTFCKKNTGNISLGTCKSFEQTRACALVCLPDLQLPREIFSVLLTKAGLIAIYFFVSKASYNFKLNDFLIFETTENMFKHEYFWSNVLILSFFS